MKRFFLISGLFLTIFSSCIKDDYVDDEVDPELRITSNVDTIAIDSSFQFEYMYLNNVGKSEEVAVTWSSSQPDILTIDMNTGQAEALALGSTIIAVDYDDGNVALHDEIEVAVGNSTVSQPGEKSGTVVSTSSYALMGDFTLKTDGAGLILEFADNYEASTSLPGLYVYLSNNSSSTANALEIGAVTVFSGAHSYTIPNVGINDYSYVLYFCKPFNVKVGDGEIQ